MFHRFVTPVYTGGLPAGYDLINVVSGGTGAGGSSPANPQKVGGPNSGTYLLADGEPLAKEYINRGFRALAENTDELDDILRRDIVVGALASETVSAGDTSFVLPAGTYLGPAGTDASSIGLWVDVRAKGGAYLRTGVDVISVASLTFTAPDDYGTGFAQNPVTVNFTHPIGAGTTYRVWYSKRSNLATASPEDFRAAIITNGFLPTASNVQATPTPSTTGGNVQDILLSMDTVKASFDVANTWTAPQTFNGGALETSAALITEIFYANYKLLWTANAFGTTKSRLYASLTGFFMTTNAVWGGASWSADDIAVDSYQTEFTNGKVSTTRRAAGAGAWVSWPAESLRMLPSSYLPTIGMTNAITPNNIVKAWAVISTNGAGAVTVLEGFNISSVTLNGSGHALVNIADDMVGEYGVWTNDLGTGGDSLYRCTTRAAGQMIIQRKVLGVLGTPLLSMSTNASLFCVQVLGKQ